MGATISKAVILSAWSTTAILLPAVIHPKSNNDYGGTSFLAMRSPSRSQRVPRFDFEYGGEYYVITRELGQGSFGKVQLATTSSGKQVAVKSLLPDKPKVSEVKQKLLKKEFETGQTLFTGLTQSRDGGSVVEYKEQITLLGLPAIIMSYAPGGSLEEATSKWMAQNHSSDPTLNTKIFLYILHQTISAINIIHSKEYVHSDLKPENFLLSSDVNEKLNFRVKITDFGLTVKEDDKIIGYNISHAAPEVIFPMTRDGTHELGAAKSNQDIWSWGRMAFVLYREFFVRLRAQGELPDERIFAFNFITPSKFRLCWDAKFDIVRNMQQIVSRTKQEYPCLDSESLVDKALEIIYRCVSFLPEGRPTAAEAAAELKVLLDTATSRRLSRGPRKVHSSDDLSPVSSNTKNVASSISASQSLRRSASQPRAKIVRNKPEQPRLSRNSLRDDRPQSSSGLRPKDFKEEDMIMFVRQGLEKLKKVYSEYQACLTDISNLIGVNSHLLNKFSQAVTTAYGNGGQIHNEIRRLELTRCGFGAVAEDLKRSCYAAKKTLQQAKHLCRLLNQECQLRVQHDRCNSGGLKQSGLEGRTHAPIPVPNDMQMEYETIYNEAKRILELESENHPYLVAYVIKLDQIHCRGDAALASANVEAADVIKRIFQNMIDETRAVLQEARRVIRDHWVPDDMHQSKMLKIGRPFLAWQQTES